MDSQKRPADNGSGKSNSNSGKKKKRLNATENENNLLRFFTKHPLLRLTLTSSFPCRNEAEYLVHSNLLRLQSEELLSEVKAGPVPLIDKAIENIKKILLKPSG